MVPDKVLKVFDSAVLRPLVSAEKDEGKAVMRYFDSYGLNRESIDKTKYLIGDGI